MFNKRALFLICLTEFTTGAFDSFFFPPSLIKTNTLKLLKSAIV